MDKRVMGGMVGIGLIIFSGCLNTTHDDVSAFHNNLKQRLGSVKWNPGDPAIQEGVESLLAKDLDLTGAIQLALVNNHRVKAIFEETGISQSHLISAGLFERPFAPRQFLDNLLPCLDKNVNPFDYTRGKFRMAQSIYDLATDIEIACYHYQAANAQWELQKTLLDAAEEAFALARRQREAGSINTLFVEDKKKEMEQVQGEMAKTEEELSSHRDRLAALMGLPKTASWRITQWLEEIPSFEPALEELEQFALGQRLDLAAAREQVVHLDTFNTAAAQRDLVPASDPLSERELLASIFDFDLRDLSRVEAHKKKSKEHLKSVEDALHAKVKEAQAQLLAARSLTQQHAGLLLPLRLKSQISAKNQNILLARNVYEMFQNQRIEVQARIYYEMALRDYWIAKAELKRLAGGLPSSKSEEE